MSLVNNKNKNEQKSNKVGRTKPQRVRKARLLKGSEVTLLRELSSHISSGQSQGSGLVFNDLYRNAVREFFGTQEPVIRLRSGKLTCSSSAGTVLYVAPIDLSSLSNYTEISAMFDEVKVLRGKIHWVPAMSTTSGQKLQVVNVMDYESATSLAFVQEALGYDTAKIFDSGDNGHKMYEQDIMVQGMPDLAWTPTTGNLTVAWSKFMQFNGALGTQVLFNGYYELDLKFRQAVGAV